MLDALECTSRFALACKHIFQMGRSRINECIIFVKASTLYFGTFLLLVQQFKILCQHHELSLRYYHEVRPVVSGPDNLFDDCSFSQAYFVEGLSRCEVVEEDCVFGLHNDFAHGCWVNHFNSVDALLVDRDLLDVSTIKIAD